MEDVDISPATIESSRSPTLDLDSLYGAGPQDPGSAQFYSDGLHLKMGAADGVPAGQGFDLPRETPGQGATIPDERNDENLAVGQIHLAMIRFHNRVVDTLPASVPAAQRFQTARRIVTKHYQWMLRTDYLPRICSPSIVTNVFSQGRKAFEVGAPPTSMPTMPVEFSVAAFRLGHSMIRADYSWNKVFPAATLGQLFDFSGLMGDLGVGSPLPSVWIADFRRLFDFGQAGRQDLVVPAGKFNRAMRIDTKLVTPLRTLRVPDPDPRKNLAFRNLLRATMVSLATGQQMVTFLKSKGLDPPKLTAAQIRTGSNGANLGSLTTVQRNALVTNTPALVLHPPRGRAQPGQAGERRRPDRRRDLPPRDAGEHLLDRSRRRLPAHPGPEQHDLPHGRPAALRLQRKGGAAESERELALRRIGSEAVLADERHEHHRLQRAAVELVLVAHHQRQPLPVPVTHRHQQPPAVRPQLFEQR